MISRTTFPKSAVFFWMLNTAAVGSFAQWKREGILGFTNPLPAGCIR
jgi:hypothetical protein